MDYQILSKIRKGEYLFICPGYHCILSFFSPKKGEALLILLEEKKGEGHFNSHAAHS